MIFVLLDFLQPRVINLPAELKQRLLSSRAGKHVFFIIDAHLQRFALGTDRIEVVVTSCLIVSGLYTCVDYGFIGILLHIYTRYG